jgi:glutathione synthase/RimK-type ligase-like ATP-grasp enzyme
MRNLVVVNDPKEWPLEIEGAEVIAARDYLTDPTWSTAAKVRVVNLCRSLRYQRTGYYVSLLADARGHRPMPSIGTIQNLKSQAVIQIAGGELAGLIETSLQPIQSSSFVLSVYFGHNVAQRHARLAQGLFQRFPSPFLQASFERSARSGKWRLKNVQPIAAGDIPPTHIEFTTQCAEEWLAKSYHRTPRKTVRPYDLAILVDPDDPEPPSNEKAMRRFVRAFEKVGFSVETIGQEDYARLGEFDALFIRDTTNVNHHTFRFACRAEALGLVVIDDPVSILRCTNKVYLAELLEQHKIKHPKTMIVHRLNVDRVAEELGLPCVLKQPDSSFSQGVAKVETVEALEKEVQAMLERSDLVIAQSFQPTEFDWRIGVLDGHPIYACRYFMAKDHWQIYSRDAQGRMLDGGKAETLPVEMAPTKVVRAALKACNLIGNGLYGVDLKEVGGEAYLIEVNDNPNIDGGFEDAMLGEELYQRIARVFLQRVSRARSVAWTP